MCSAAVKTTKGETLNPYIEQIVSFGFFKKRENVPKGCLMYKTVASTTFASDCTNYTLA